MKNVSINHSSRSGKSLYRLVALTLFAAAALSSGFISSQSVNAQTAEVVDHRDDLTSNEHLSDENNDQDDAEQGRDLDADPPAIEATGSAERKFTTTHLVQISVITIIILWGYSLVMSGKLGLGWMVLSVIFGVFGYFGRMIKSLFQEVTSSNEVGDWDDE